MMYHKVGGVIWNFNVGVAGDEKMKSKILYVPFLIYLKWNTVSDAPYVGCMLRAGTFINSVHHREEFGTPFIDYLLKL